MVAHCFIAPAIGNLGVKTLRFFAVKNLCHPETFNKKNTATKLLRYFKERSTTSYFINITVPALVSLCPSK
jgi:hypothetical protein